MRRLLAFICTMVLAFSAAPALAQSDTGEINIVVQDANSKKPIVLARVLLDGPVMTSEFTGDNGKVRFTDVPDGIYRARVMARGFQPVTSANFEIINGRNVTVTVSLALSQGGPLKTIASAVVKSSAAISTTAVTADSAQRKLSNDLADALGKLSGVNVTTSSSDADATQTVSLEGQDPSQTALTVDGIPLNAPGTAGNLRGINSDLFGGANVSFGPQLGGLAGGVNFRSIDPTLSWQSAFSLSVGSNGKNNYSIAETGSLGKLGVALMHTYRMSPSLLDGMQYLDASGLYYTHEADQQTTGSLVKLRYQLSDEQTLTGMYMHSTGGSELACTQDTGILPCGYGPDNFYDTAFDLYSLTDNALVGATQLQASFFGSKSTNTHDLLNRFIGGVAAPTGSLQSSGFDGLSLNATLPAQQRHTISVSAYTTSSHSTFTPLNAAAQPYTFPGQNATYTAISVNDSFRSNAKLRFNDSIGISRASNAPSSLLLGVGSMWQPTASDSYSFSYNIGGVAPHAGRSGTLSDPGQLRIDCNGNIAYGSAPGDQPGASNSTSARFSYTHRGNWGLVSASLYRQVQNDVVLPVEVNGTALASGGIFPPDYWGQVQTVYDSTCGSTSQAVGPANTYFTTPIAGVRRDYEGAQINGYFTLGNLVVQPYYNVQVAKAISLDPRFDNPYAITISGNQLPNVPLHRAGVTLDYKAPHSILEWLADAHYTGSNNSQNLPAYTTVDAGVSANLTHGTLSFVASNIFNTYGGIFSGPQFAVPYTAANGTQIATIARPNTPRQLAVTYTVHFGQGAQQPSARALTEPEGLGGGRGQGGGRRGFGQFMQPLPSSPPADPLALNASALCTPDAQKTAQPVLSALKAYVAQIEAAKTGAGYPDTMPPANVPGMTVTYHGMKSTYALSIAVKQISQMRSLFGCTTFHRADLETAQQRNLYVPPAGGGMFFRPSITFMPAVGLYFVQRPPQAGAESFRVYKLPTAPPAAPFALHAAAQSCTPEMRSTAQATLAQLQDHFTKNTAAPDWAIAAHSAASGTWYSMQPQDIDSVPALLNCAHVSSATKDELTKLGWDGATIPSLNYTPKLGLYMVAPQRRQPGASPSPAPSATP